MEKKSKSSSSKDSFSENDWINMLHDDLLHMIVLRLSTEDAVKTSLVATRWVDLWRHRPHLELDMRKIMQTTPTMHLKDASVEFALSMTKVLNDHCGDLESCVIHHFSPQSRDGTLKSWIDTVLRVKHTKDLTLVNLRIGDGYDHNLLELVDNAFSYPNLTSLSLRRFSLVSICGFIFCSNLKILKLLNILITHATILTKVFEACSSLEVIVLEFHCLGRHSVLKIVNNNLKFLKVTSHSKIHKTEVHATCLHVLDIGSVKTERDNFILDAPNIRFNRNYWIARSSPNAHMSYDISALAQEKTSAWHELIVSEFYNKRRHGSLSVRVDITNPIEVKILKEVLLMWSEEMKELEILFKTNIKAPGEEGVTLWENTKPFPNADFHVHTLWIYNFSGSIKKEFALLSRFMTQKTVIEKMMIETSKFPPVKKVKVEADVAKLMQITKGNKGFSIECF